MNARQRFWVRDRLLDTGKNVVPANLSLGVIAFVQLAYMVWPSCVTWTFAVGSYGALVGWHILYQIMFLPAREVCASFLAYRDPKD